MEEFLFISFVLSLVILNKNLIKKSKMKDYFLPFSESLFKFNSANGILIIIICITGGLLSFKYNYYNVIFKIMIYMHFPVLLYIAIKCYHKKIHENSELKFGGIIPSLIILFSYVNGIILSYFSYESAIIIIIIVALLFFIDWICKR